MNTASRCLLTITFLVCPIQLLHAQVITSTEIERGLSTYGATANGYVPFSHRYFYGTGPYVYLNGSAQQLRYLDYQDRADRAEKFGYRMPTPPPDEPPAMRGSISGGGFGIWRRR